MATNRASVKIAPGAVICDECELVGDITIGTRTVIHPKARIIAEAGPIIIGEFNIVEELVEIINRCEDKDQNQQVMIIGNNNVFEVSAHVECMKIGDHNIVESKAKVGRQLELTSGCIIGVFVNEDSLLTSNEKLPENLLTVIHGSNCERRTQRERPPAQTLQIDFLAKILPNYHYLKKPAKMGTPQR
ncbi:LOW QUALITY PROTEIN: dynactin subunit 6-like [Haliotis rubra]|uniref:LOW QUALITY PROTEIN: dynactin subunit 6-like n=1 Tax=Haliotis rubra TaxID=36100 RepID=UPI001EE4FB91|nr:LOW QUALITY PROTEIN: dynactin subunit 6-like [Haliotis rubra]